MVVTNGGYTIGLWWVETRDTAKHPTIDRTGPVTQNYWAQHVGHAEVEGYRHREERPVLG